MAIRQGKSVTSVASIDRRFYLRSVEDLRPLSNGEFGEPGVAELLVYVVSVDGNRTIEIDEVRIGIEYVREAA